MKHSFSRKQMGLAVACALALGLVSGTASAQSALRQTDGQCIHTGFDDPATLAAVGCNPGYRPVAAYVAPAPQPVAAAPVAAVGPVAELAPAPARQKLTFDADMLFGFDKSVLRPEGRATLDNFADRIKGINPEVIVTVGHADRIGSSEYNQTLSEERADSVKAYLVSIGIASDRVQTSGRGETQPVTLAADCPSGSANVIACLQPDRRVDIELIGAKIRQ